MTAVARETVELVVHETTAPTASHPIRTRETQAAVPAECGDAEQAAQQAAGFALRRNTGNMDCWTHAPAVQRPVMPAGS